MGKISQNLVQANERVFQQEEECSNLAMELKLVKTQVLEGNYKVNNFDAIKKSAMVCASISVTMCGCVQREGHTASEG